MTTKHDHQEEERSEVLESAGVLPGIVFPHSRSSVSTPLFPRDERYDTCLCTIRSEHRNWPRATVNLPASKAHPARLLSSEIAEQTGGRKLADQGLSLGGWRVWVG